MKKITFLVVTFCISSCLFINAQSTFTETVDIDISGISTYDGQGSPNNVILTVLLDGLASYTGCNDPVLEITGLGWDTNQTTAGLSWLSEMVIATDANQDGAAEVNITTGIGDDFAGSGTYSSAGIIDLVGVGLPYSLIANAVSGSMDIEFFEGFDDVAGAIDGTYDPGSTLTVQYRLSCSNVLGVNDVADLGSVAMYPNVVKSVVTFSNPKFLNLQKAQIYDFTGKLVQTIDLSNMNTETTVDLSALASANYLVKIQTESGNIVKRLIKQ